MERTRKMKREDAREKYRCREKRLTQAACRADANPLRKVVGTCAQRSRDLRAAVAETRDPEFNLARSK